MISRNKQAVRKGRRWNIGYRRKPSAPQSKAQKYLVLLAIEVTMPEISDTAEMSPFEFRRSGSGAEPEESAYPGDLVQTGRGLVHPGTSFVFHSARGRYGRTTRLGQSQRPDWHGVCADGALAKT